MRQFLQQLGVIGAKEDIGHLPMKAKLHCAVVAIAAIAVVAQCAREPQRVDWGPFLLYLICSAATAGWKVPLPGLTGTLSVNSLFVLVSSAELSMLPTILVACAGGIAQLFFSARTRPNPIQVQFVLSSMTVCAAATFWTCNCAWLPKSVAIRLLCSSMAYFLTNTGMVAAIIAFTSGKNFLELWRSNFFWTAPHYLAGGATAGFYHVWNRYVGWQTAVLVFPVLYLVYQSYKLYLGRLEEEKHHVDDMASLHLRTIQSLALAIDARDGTTYSHLRRVQVFAREIARELGLPEAERQALDAAALLHDIGKLAVPEHILSKPGKLTPEEFERMKVHPQVGADILDSVQFPYPVVPIVRSHHEKWDGSGYPQGLSGEQIPLGARILAAVDCMDALASDRQYRRAIPLEEAVKWVADGSGTIFDPKVVEVLLRRYKECENLATLEHIEPAHRPMAAPTGNSARPDAGLETSVGGLESSRPGFIHSIAEARLEFQTLHEITQELGNSLRMDETLALLASRLRALIPYNGIAIYTTEEQHLVTRYADGEDAALFRSLAIPLGEGISGWVTLNNKPLINGNPSVEPGYLSDPSKFSIHRSALSAPLTGMSGVIGALTLYHRGPDAFTKDHLRVLLAISSKAGLTIENALSFVKAQETATTDGLTGLPNARSLFLTLDNVLGDALAESKRLAVLVADMDGFKQVNDQFGHAVGNQVLVRTAEALGRVCRKGDFVARMGGDEFVLVLPEVDGRVVAERIRQMDELVRKAGLDICGVNYLRLSVGASFFPEDGTDAEELIAAADAQMYEMKRLHHAARADGGDLSYLAEATMATDDLTEVQPVAGLI